MSMKNILAQFAFVRVETGENINRSRIANTTNTADRWKLTMIAFTKKKSSLTAHMQEPKP